MGHGQGYGSSLEEGFTFVWVGPILSIVCNYSVRGVKNTHSQHQCPSVPFGWGYIYIYTGSRFLFAHMSYSAAIGGPPRTARTSVQPPYRVHPVCLRRWIASSALSPALCHQNHFIHLGSPSSWIQSSLGGQKNHHGSPLRSCSRRCTSPRWRRSPGRRRWPASSPGRPRRSIGGTKEEREAGRRRTKVGRLRKIQTTVNRSNGMKVVKDLSYLVNVGECCGDPHIFKGNSASSGG